MTDLQAQLLSSFEGHDIEAVGAALEAGADVFASVRGLTPVEHLLREYTRSDRFAECLRLLLDRGATLKDERLKNVLLNDAERLREEVRSERSMLTHRTNMHSAFTPLAGATLLHVAAEYGNLDAARVLIEEGCDVNARAHFDPDGLNGHTPIFHTVNSNRNRSQPVMRLLLEFGARTDILLAGLNWGSGYSWETTFFDITPVSYAQMGLLPQMHRSERDVYENIALLLEAGQRNLPQLPNVPNRYLQTGH